VADITADRASPKSQRQPQSPTVPPRSVTMTVAGAILLLAGGCAIGYSLGWVVSGKVIRDLQTDQANDKRQIRQLTSQLSEGKAANDTLNSDLKQATDKLNEIFKSARQITVKANESQRVLVGDLTVGLTDVLGSGSVNVNINGEKQNMAPADRRNLTFNCSIEMQSFDVPNASATFNTSCSPSNTPRKAATLPGAAQSAPGAAPNPPGTAPSTPR